MGAPTLWQLAQRGAILTAALKTQIWMDNPDRAIIDL
jgi:hypothetical protein